MSLYRLCRLPLLAVILSSALAMPDRHAHAQAGSPNPVICYSISDQPAANPAGDELIAMDRSTGAFTNIGPTGTVSAETMAVNVAGTTLYTVDNPGPGIGRLGTLNLDPANGALGRFDLIGDIGTGTNVVQGPHNFDDVDSLQFDGRTGYLWGITQSSPRNVMFRIDPATGHFVPNAFGPGFDYAEVDLTGIPTAPTDIDDLAIDPVTGRFLAIANGAGTNDRIVQININGFDPANSPGFNPATGRISTTDVAMTTNAANGTEINDVEGFSSFNDGTFYATTGSVGTPANTMWRVNTSTAQLTQIGAFPSPWFDTEAVGCLTAGSNRVTGTIFADNNGNGVFDGGDTPTPNITLRFYIDANNNNVVDAGDTLIQTTTSNGSGFYSFETARAGSFVVEIDLADPDLPAGFSMTTPIVQEADFFNTGAPYSEYGHTEANNDFGYQLSGGPVPPPPPPPPPADTPVPAPVIVPATAAAPATPAPQTNQPGPVITVRVDPPFVQPGGTVTIEVTVSNPGPSPVSSVVISGSVPSGIQIQSASSSAGSIAVNGQTVTLTQELMGQGGVTSATIQAIVPAGLTLPFSGQSVWSLVAAEFPTPREASGQVAVIGRLPATGQSPWSVWRTPLLGLIALAGVLGGLALAKWLLRAM